MRLVLGLTFPSVARMAERPGWQTHLLVVRPTHLLAASLTFPSMLRVAVSVQAAALARVARRALAG